MLSDRNNPSAVPRLGELFVEAGIVRKEVVHESLAVAKRAQLPIGRVLVMSGYVNDRDVDCAVRTQAMIVEGQATRASASRLLRLVHCNKITIEEAQSRDNYERAFTMPFSQLGRLFLAAQVLSEKHLLAATHESCQRHMPLGRFLVREGAITQDFLIAGINCLILVRDKKIARLEAVEMLRSIHSQQDAALRDTMINHSLGHLVENKSPKLCDLLISAGLLSISDAAWALEMSMETGNRAGQILVRAGMVSDSLLESTLQLQKMIGGGTLRLARAAELLKLCQELNEPLESVLAEFDKLNQVIEFLRHGHIFSEQLIREIAAHTPDFDNNCGAVLLRRGLVTPEMLTKAARCLSFFRTAKLTEQQALDAYKISVERNISPDDALQFINWDHHNRHGSHELLGKIA